MSKARTIRLCILSSLMILVILDSHTACQSVVNSINLCIYSVIPSIFPFLFLGSAIAAELRISKFSILEKVLHIPKNTATYFLIGLICGYPVGAKLLQDAADSQKIDPLTAKRMMCFCNNASPAFIIGILSAIFDSPFIALCMWFIQICSSLMIGYIIPGRTNQTGKIASRGNQNIGTTLSSAMKTVTTICGWVISFAVVLSYAKKYVIPIGNPVLNILISGTLELTNGIFELSRIGSKAIQFILSSILLSFGGICIILQTYSVAPSLEIRKYIYARLLHAAISAALSSISVLFLFPEDRNTLNSTPLFICAAIVCCMIFIFNKKMVAIEVTI